MKKLFLFRVLSLFVNGVFGDIVPVMEGDSVTLHTHLDVIQTDDVLEWSFGEERTLIAIINRAANKISLSNDNNNRFNGKLKLNNQTGDLTITNIRSEHTGEYQLDITNEKTITRRFSVRVFGDTGGVKQVSVMEGDSVTLHTDVTDTQRYDEILWLFEPGNTIIAQINRADLIFFVNYNADKRTLSKLHLDHQKGDLTIRNIGAAQSGLYQVHIISRTHTIHKRFNITVSDRVKSVSVMKGDSVTLHTDGTVLQRDFVLWWSTGIFIAGINKTTPILHAFNDADKRFKNRIQINSQAGDLTITNIRTEDSGLYYLEISDSRHTSHRTFIINVCDAVRSVEVNKGEAVSLKAGVATQMYNQLEWKFTDKGIFLAQLNKTGHMISTHDERFRDRLHLDHETGDLTIRDARTKHSGVYHLEINTDVHTTFKKFNLTVLAQSFPFDVSHLVVICSAVIPLLLMLSVVIIYRCVMFKKSKRQQSRKLHAYAAD